MKEINNHVENILRNYTTMKNEVQVLEFELSCITPSLHPKVIENKVFSRSGSERVAGSHISDKTADIAVEHIDSQRNSVHHAMCALVRSNRLEISRLEYYISLIPADEADVIRLFYFEKLGWEVITRETDCSLSTLQRRKKRGMDKLARYYSILDGFSPGNKLNLRARLCFVSYIHEERYIHCLQRTKKRTPGIEALLFILSGSNELWDVGVDTFFDFGESTMVSYSDMNVSLSEDGQVQLRLAFHLIDGIDRQRLVHELRYCCASLEDANLELAIEAIKLALLPSVGSMK